MDREILFHGKRKDNGEWVEGYYTHVGPTNDMRHYIIPYYASAFYGIEVDPSTVGQYTGLTDKHGKKIFEGDCIKVVIKKYGYDGMTETETTQKGLVAYDSIGMIGLVLEVRDGRNLWSDCFLELSMSDSIIDYRLEIIGNIHDNPELLN